MSDQTLSILNLAAMNRYKAYMTVPERETREALAAYKDALIRASHRPHRKVCA